MFILEVILLGLIHGITEFLPIAATGYLLLLRDLLDYNSGNQLALSGMLHLTTAMAAMVYLRSEIWTMLQAMLRKLGRLPVNEKDITLFYAFCSGTIPAVLVIVFIGSQLRPSLPGAGMVAGLSFLTVVLLMYAEWRYYTRSVTESLTIRRGLLIGLFQTLVLLPGFSRIGAAIAGGMLLGLSRVEATRFSFLLSIPIMLGMGGLELLGLITMAGAINWPLIFSVCAVTFVLALITMQLFLAFMSRYTLWAFIWYGVVLAALTGYIGVIA